MKINLDVSCDTNNITPLLFACNKNNYAITKCTSLVKDQLINFLLDNGLDLNVIQTNNNFNALMNFCNQLLLDSNKETLLRLIGLFKYIIN